MRYKASTFLLVAILTAPHLAEAQQTAKTVPRIGFIVSSGNPSSPQLESFRLGLRDLGYVENKNITLNCAMQKGDWTGWLHSCASS
jgi:hypothetical protein